MKLVAGPRTENPIGGIECGQDGPAVEVSSGEGTTEQTRGGALALGSDGDDDDHRVERPESLHAQQLEPLTAALLQCSQY